MSEATTDTLTAELTAAAAESADVATAATEGAQEAPAEEQPVTTQEAPADTPAAPAEAPAPTETDERVAAMELKLAEAEKRAEAAEASLAELTDTTSKNKALADAGLDEKYAKFLSGGSHSWADQIKMLQELRGGDSPKPAGGVQRDPAVDAASDEVDSALSAATQFFGF
nr:MAG TPA: hypothetical protein [Caudoviricetes sp.]